MSRRKTRSLRCPTCRKLVLLTGPEFPFCSKRCRLIDLGKWASGAYVISTPVNDPESGGEAEYTEQPRSAVLRPAPTRTADVSRRDALDEPSQDEKRKPN